jgi:hypothetical protein
VNHRQIVLYVLLVILGILPLLFRRVFILRCACILLLLAASSVAFVGVELSSHTAIREQAEKNSSAAAISLEMDSPFRRGATLTAQAARESLPTFIIVIGALTLMAFVPLKRQNPSNKP